MKKQILAVCLTIVMILALTIVPASASDAVASTWGIIVDGVEFELNEGELYSIGGRNMLQLRAMFERLLGFEPEEISGFWNGGDRSVTVPLPDGGFLRMVIDNPVAEVLNEDGEILKEIRIDAANDAVTPLIIIAGGESRTYLPLRFLLEDILGYTVSAHVPTRTVHVISDEYIQAADTMMLAAVLAAESLTIQLSIAVALGEQIILDETTEETIPLILPDELISAIAAIDNPHDIDWEAFYTLLGLDEDEITEAMALLEPFGTAALFNADVNLTTDIFVIDGVYRIEYREAILDLLNLVLADLDDFNELFGFTYDTISLILAFDFETGAIEVIMDMSIAMDIDGAASFTYAIGMTIRIA
jgi:hypothetical protein